MKKQTIILFICLAMVCAAIGAALWLRADREQPEEQSTEQEVGEQAQENELENEHGTNSIIYFEGDVPPADPLMVGRWTSMANASWHKVYYDDDDGEGHYWGKEWDEADDVLEEDLSYHGNGWFRWVKSNDTLYEFSTMDFRDVPIAHIYYITVFDSMNISMAETNKRSTHYFIKE
jgi:hypothetical protein